MKKIIFSFALLSISLVSFAQLITPFTVRYSITQKGGITMLANTAAGCGTNNSDLTCTNGTCATAHNELPPGGVGVDNDFVLGYTDIDGDGTTWMSSSDSLNLPSCSTISFAGLYWGAGGTTSDPNGSHWATRTSVKLKVNNGSYLSLTADASQDNTTGYKSYHNFKDITSIVAAAGGKARFTIANMPMLNDNGTGNNATNNRWGGWAIVIVYKNDLLPQKNLTVFNGLTNVSAQHTTTDLPISGFLTPPSGPVSVELGLVTYDGDRGLNNTCTDIYKGDSLLFRSGTGSFVPVYDAIHPKNDVFNSTISYNGVLTPYRNPSYNNTLGHDANIFVPNNSTKNYIGNSATSATLRQKTGGETYLTQVVTTAIDVYAPDLRGGLSVVDLNGGTAQPGDTLEYTMSIKNIGDDLAINSYVTDTLAQNVTYVPGSIRVTSGPNSGNKTDVISDDQAEYFASAGSLRVRIGTGANSTTGGSVNYTPIGADSTQIKFKVVITTNCTILLCNNIVHNRFWVYGTGNISGLTYGKGSNPIIFNYQGCPIDGSTNTVVSSATCGGPTASGTPTVCERGTINLYVQTVSGASYSWTGPNGFTSSSQNPVITNATPAMSGTYTVTINSLPSCSYGTTVSIMVNPAPLPTISSNGPLCISNTLNLSTPTVAGATYSWSGPNGFSSSDQNPSIVNVTLANAGTYSLTETNSATGCSSVVVSTIVVVDNFIQTTPTAGNNSPLCEGNTINLSTPTVAGVTYSWTGPNGFTSSNQNPVINNATVSMAGTYSVTLTNVTPGCTSAVGTTTVVVNSTPSTPLINVNTPVCSGSAINLTTPAVSGVSYNWTGPNGFTSSSQNPNIINASSAMAGTYNLTETNSVTGCTSLAGTAVLTVIPPIDLNPTASSNSPVCEGNAINLSTPTVQGFSYTWTGPNSFVSYDQNPIITGSTSSMAGEYDVVLTDLVTGCKTINGAGTIVVVNASPTVGANASSSNVCNGASVTLTGSGASNYSWTGGVTDGTPFTPQSSGSYTVTGTDENGCSNSASVSVAVNMPPTVGANASSSNVCNGASVTLTGSGASNYSWTGGVTDGTPFTPQSSGSYTVTGTDENGCSNSASVSVAVNMPPTVGANASSSNVCNGASVTLTGSGASNYSWTGGVTDGTPFTPQSSGSYTVTGTDENGCSNSASVSVAVNMPPTVGANASSSNVCNGSSVTLTGSGASNYSWTGGVTDGTPFTPQSSGSYTVTGTDENGCSNSASVSVAVNMPPTVGANASSSNVCNGSSVTLTGSGASSYSWTGGVTDGTPFTPQSSGSYTVTGTDENGCSSSASVSVAVNMPPTVGANASSSNVCNGSSVTLTGSGASNYSWTGGVTDGTPFTPQSSGSYTVTGTDENGCSNSASVLVAVNMPPTVGANASSSNVCNGSSVTLTGSGASNYSWTGGVTDGTPFTPQSSGSYTVTGTDENGCSNSASVLVAVNMPPTVGANASSSNVCNGASVTLTGSGASNYSWTGGVTDGTPFTPQSSGSYTVTGTDENGCSNSASVSVAVNMPPTVGANASSSNVCNGASVTLTGSGASNYSWTGGVTDGTPFTPQSSGSYTVTGTDENGCSNTASVSVAVNMPPTVGANASSSNVCNGASVTLTGSGASNYSWTGGVTDGTPFTPQSSGSYTVTGTDENGCSNTASVAISVSSITVTANASSTTVCNGASVILTGGGATNYSWTGGVIDGTPFTPQSSGTYTVTGTNGSGCSNTASVSITVNTPPTVTANASSSSVCNGASVTLTGGGAGSGATYGWTGGVTDGTPFIPQSSGSYTVTGTDNNGCSNTASVAISVGSITVTANASSTTVCNGSSVTLTGGGATNYSWTGGVTDGVPFTPQASGTYTVTGTSGACSNTASIAITVGSITVTANASSTNVCDGTPVTLTGGGATNYSWTGGVTDGVSFVPQSSGSYTVTGTDNNGCSNTASVSVTVNTLLPTPTVNSNSPVCDGSAINLTTPTVIGATYSWSGPNGFTSSSQNPTISSATLAMAGTYSLSISSTGSVCPSANGTTTVVVNATPAAPSAGSNSPVCIGNELDLTASAAQGATFAWSSASYSSALQNPVIPNATTSMSGSYQVTASINGCTSAPTTVNVSVVDCGTDLSITKTVDIEHPVYGGTVVFTITVTNNGPNDASGVTVVDALPSGYSYVSSTTTIGSYDNSTGIWTLGSIANGGTETLTVTATVNTTGNYVNTATVNGGQSDPKPSNNTASAQTYPTNLNIPEGFSPNGDGVNDLFVIRGLDSYPSNIFTIFNRWGDKVYEAKPYNNTWDGTNNQGLNVGGNQLPIGTYFYVLDLGDGTKAIKGTIYLNR